ncbi:unnamed protein product [marine sediment metagenome]|uniref:Uncharacterized protein n=1 Tax=marine sediment metagenome TaxID=412755 RepID=X1I1R1_9ZZZZ
MAENIMGIDSKNENFKESSLDNPLDFPITVVIPDLEIPGTMAIA